MTAAGISLGDALAVKSSGSFAGRTDWALGRHHQDELAPIELTPGNDEVLAVLGENSNDSSGGNS